MMKRILARILAAALLLASLTGFASAGDYLLMQDVQKDNWYYSAVRSALQQGLLTARSSHSFVPNQPITRGELVTAFGRLAEIDTASYDGGCDFSDVKGELIPYVNWAASLGIVNGTGADSFSPDALVTRQTYAAMAGAFVTALGIELPEVEFPQYFADADLVADWALEGYEMLSQAALLQGDTNGNFHPDSPLTRAQAAVLLTRLGRTVQADYPIVYEWVDWEDLDCWEDPVIPPAEMLRVAEEWGFDEHSSGWIALCLINDYSDDLSESDKAGTLVFLIEGAGSTADTSKRMNAMCVVVTDGEVTYLNRNCTTIPDDPFDPGKNDGMAMPTLNSGVYRYCSVNQPGSAGSYAALNVVGANVVRFRNSTTYYQSTSAGINIHRRNSNNTAPASASWANSFGCSLIGLSGTSVYGDYAKFIAAVGLVDPGTSGNSTYDHSVSGKVIVDRSMARDYLLAIGYPEAAVDMIG